MREWHVATKWYAHVLINALGGNQAQVCTLARYYSTTRTQTHTSFCQWHCLPIHPFKNLNFLNYAHPTFGRNFLLWDIVHMFGLVHWLAMEPTSVEWEGSILPLNHQCMWYWLSRFSRTMNIILSFWRPNHISFTFSIWFHQEITTTYGIHYMWPLN